MSVKFNASLRKRFFRMYLYTVKWLNLLYDIKKASMSCNSFCLLSCSKAFNLKLGGKAVFNFLYMNKLFFFFLCFNSFSDFDFNLRYEQFSHTSSVMLLRTRSVFWEFYINRWYDHFTPLSVLHISIWYDHDTPLSLFSTSIDATIMSLHCHNSLFQ